MKRAYRRDGRSAPLWIIRAAIIVGFPFIAGYGIAKEMASACRSEWRANISDFKRYWRGGMIE